MKNEKNKGFSLIELIIVIAIMAILVSMVALSVIAYVHKAEMAKVKEEAVVIRDEFIHSLCWGNDKDNQAEVKGTDEWSYEGTSHGVNNSDRVGTLTNYTMHRIQSGSKLPLDTTTNRAGEYLYEEFMDRVEYAVTDNIQGMTFKEFYEGISEQGKYAGLIIIYNKTGYPFRVLYSNKGYFVDINDGEVKAYTTQEAIDADCTFKVTTYLGA